MTHSIFSLFLKELGVKHTTEYANNLYESHSDKNSLWSISDLLSKYGVKNSGIKLEDKNIDCLDAPFIAHAGEEFVVVSKVTTDWVEYAWNHEKIKLSVNEFKRLWSGIALVAETSASSIEPNYNEHRKKKYIASLKLGLIILSVCWFITYSFFTNHLYNSVAIMLLLLANVLAVVTCFLLAQKQMNTESRYADKICSLFKQKTCNNVLESDASKLLGIFGWSEIGLSYFVANILLLSALPHLAQYLALINILALPYTCWSIWYQYRIVKQWCMLCVIVQLLLWILFAINLLFGYIVWPAWHFLDVMILGAAYLFVFGVLNYIIEKITKENKLLSTEFQLRSLKMQREVFEAQLKEQPRYDVSLSVSSVFFGNPDSGMFITIVTNPHCNPCAAMHQQVEDLLKTTHRQVCVQYVFTAFNPSLVKSSLFLIAAYLKETNADARSLYTRWFAKEKHNPETFVNSFDYDLRSADVEGEWEQHQKWVNNMQINATPTVLINGYKLPDTYNLSDMKYFIQSID